MTQYTISQPREKDGNTYWTNLGKAWPLKNREGFSLILNALPLTYEGECRIIMTPDEEKQDRKATARVALPDSDTDLPDENDDIPF